MIQAQSGTAEASADILVVDDTPENLRVVVSLLKEAGYKARGIPNGQMALQAVAKQPPDLILLDIRMPGMDGFQVCEALRDNPQSRDIPVIFLSALTDTADKQRAFDLGGEDYITKPFQAEEVLARVNTHLELARNRLALIHTRGMLEKLSQKQEQIAPKATPAVSGPALSEGQADILVVDDDTENLRLMIDLLRKGGYRARGVSSGGMALQAVDKQPPDLILLDILMPGMDGYQVCTALREQVKNRDIPLIFLTQLTDMANMERAFKAGAVDYIIKPVKPGEMLARVSTHLRLRRMQLGLEQMVAERAAELAASEEKFRIVAEQAPIALVILDQEERIQFYNRRFTEVFGYTQEETPTTEEWWLLAYPDEAYRNTIRKRWEEAVEQAVNMKAEILPQESWVTCRNGERRYIEWRMAPLGKFGLVLGTDITERKQAEEKLLHYKDQLEETIQQRTAELVLARDAAEAANQAKSIFLANMSHELRTPLNAILGFSSLISRESQLTAIQRENLNIINRSGEHLLTLINDVLEMSKIDAGRVELRHDSFNLVSMIRDVVDMMEIRAREKGLRLLFDQSSQFPSFIRGDQARLRQILINLVGNAVKFTQQGRVSVRLATVQNADAHLMIEVEDSGPGISAEDQQRLFQPFVQLGHPAAQKGTGLGLAITRQYLQLMGGSIEVKSTLGAGSIFRVDLPLELADAIDVAESADAGSSEVLGLAPNQPEYRILIAEDQSDNQLLLSTLMQNIGIPFKTADNGEQAIQLFQDWQPHLIWMDRRMPVVDGIEATNAIRGLPGGKDVKIVAVTTSAFKEQRDEIFKAGMDDFVRKPYRFNEIYECLSRQLGIRYIYANKQTTAEAEITPLTAEMLSVLPSKLRSELRDALEILDSKLISTIVKQVGSYDASLHNTLSRLADNFDYPTILNALQTDLPADDT